jgi:flagellar protein FliS
MTASPQQLVVMLYDGAIRFLRQAEVAAEEGAWAHAGDRVTLAEAILDELLVTLDKERGGEIAVQLQAIYAFSKKLLIEARLQRDAERLRQVAGLLRPLREAFDEIVVPG